MPNLLETQIYEIAALTFEETAYLEAYPNEMPPEAPAEEGRYMVHVGFNGHDRGGMILSVTEGLLPVISENTLGEDAPPALERQRDAVGEIANIICGNLLPCVAGRKAVFHVEAPRSVEDDELNREREGASRAPLRFDEGMAEVIFWYGEEADLDSSAGG
jgi:CheY-specific phosphatase CheX